MTNAVSNRRRCAVNYIQNLECTGFMGMDADYDVLTMVFKALAHPARLQIVDMLRGGELCVCHIEAALGKRQAYISQQLMFLRESGLVESRKDGLMVFYRLADPLVERLLNAALASEASPVEAISGCRCPQCQVSEPVRFESRSDS